MFLQDYFIEISNDNEVLSVVQKITAHIETSARQCQVTNCTYVDHYVFIIHEINMYVLYTSDVFTCIHVDVHVYRLYVYVCVCVCFCYNYM